MEIGGGELMEIVSRRRRFLRALGPSWSTKDDLESTVDVSRSTIDRALRELEMCDLVEQDGARFRLTAVGTLVMREFDRYRRRLAGIERAASMLTVLDPDTEIDGVLFDEMTIVKSGQDSPRRPVDEHTSLIERATRVRTIGAVVLPQLVETYHRRIVRDGMGAQLLLTNSIVARLLSAYRDEFREGIESGRVSIREIDEQPPYSVIIAETETDPAVGLLFSGETEILGFIGTERAEAVDWAVDRFETLWEDARPLVGLSSSG